MSAAISRDVRHDDDVSVYGRVANGFRGPSIQGRDIAFFAPPSIAASETVQSYEAGFKSTLLDGTLRLNAAAYTYEVNDIQLTAVGGGGNLVQLVNADKGQAVGFEVDAEWAPIDNLVFTGGVSFVDSEIDDPNLAVGICAQCTITDPTVVIRGSTRALVDDPGWHLALDLRNMLIVSECIAKAALAREESRGGHTRDDFPGPDAEWGTKNLVVNLNAEGTGVDLHEKPLPEMPDELKGYFA